MQLHFPYNLLLLEPKPKILGTILDQAVYKGTQLWVDFLFYTLILQKVIYRVPSRRRSETLVAYVKRLPYPIATHLLFYHVQQANRNKVILLGNLLISHKFTCSLARSIDQHIKHLRTIELALRVYYRSPRNFFW